MPLSPPVERTPQHIRRIQFSSFLRKDGLWDIEGALLDTKAVDMPRRNGKGIRKAGDPIHQMGVRLTFDRNMVVQSIEAVMDTHPFGGCPEALRALQSMVGASMTRGWRKTIDLHLGKTSGCTHMRDLLQGLATAAFQSVVPAFSDMNDQPPAYLGQCSGWRLDGAAVEEYFPQFFSRLDLS